MDFKIPSRSLGTALVLTMSHVRRTAANTGPGFYLFLLEPLLTRGPSAPFLCFGTYRLDFTLTNINSYLEFGPGILASLGVHVCASVYVCSVLILSFAILTVPPWGCRIH